MNFIFYSTTSVNFNASTFHYYYNPTCKTQLEELASIYPDDNFVIVTNLPGMFLLDLQGDTLPENNKASKIKYVITQETDITKFSELILNEKPDAAIAITAFFRPFDNQGFKDSLIAEELENHNVRTICTPLHSQELCFNKFDTQIFLEQNHFLAPKSLYVHHDLFWAERNHRELKENLYKIKIYSQISKMKLPLIIKDTTGLSSYGMEVVTTYNQAKAFLESKKNNGDKLIQELIEGQQFGVEVYGIPGNYTVSSPFNFSVNQYKITSPKQSIKLGPVNKTDYNLEELKSEIIRLSELLQINGSAQIDLVYKDGKWYIIEINPRISGMTQSVMHSMNTSIFKILIQCAKNQLSSVNLSSKNTKAIISIKLPLLTKEQETEILKLPYILQLNQTINEEAKQEREKGYCEIILWENGSSLKKNLDNLKLKFPDLIDDGFYCQANEMLKNCN